jgi:hypothetical protein
MKHNFHEQFLMNNGNGYMFMHIPKTGGCAIKKAINNSENPIIHVDHDRKENFKELCFLYERIVTVFREPVSRFISSYGYYVYGSARRHKPLSISVDKYIELMKVENIYSRSRGCWKHHYYPQSYFIKEHLHKTTILIYSKNLNETWNKFLLLNNMTPVILKPHNVTKKQSVVLNDDHLSFLHEYYKDDFALWKEITEGTNPNLRVIK